MSLGTVATSGLLYKPHMIDEDDCGAIGGMEVYSLPNTGCYIFWFRWDTCNLAINIQR
jgi:hypothetical protein